MSATSPPVWLRGPAFDRALVAVPLLLALAAGHVVLAAPGLFLTVFLVDTWLLGFHHVVATWSKLGLAPDDRREALGFALLLPLAVAAALGVAAAGGEAAVWTVFFYWQWWHYTRQAWGISRVLARRAGRGPDLLAAVVLHAWPVAGLANRAHEEFGFFVAPMHHPPVPAEVVILLVGLAAAATLAWAAREVRDLRRGQGAPLHAAFLVTHTVMFAWGYLVTEGMTGWLVVNIWHNAQYLLFVWHAHAARFGRGEHPRLARLATPAGTALLVAGCLALMGATYGSIHLATSGLVLAGAPATLLVVQAINWHHYVVDALIWRLRRPRVAAALGLAPAG